MISVKIDYLLLVDFYNLFNNKIKNYEVTNENKLIRKFFEFLSKYTELSILNLPEDPDDRIMSLIIETLNKGNFNKEKSKKFNKPHKYKFPKETDIHSVYFLNEPNEIEQNNYRKNNGLLFGFNQNYLDVFKHLILFDKIRKLAVNKDKIKGVYEDIFFKNWEKLNDYFTPLTDMVIIDRYIFSKFNYNFNDFNKSMDLNLIPMLNVFATKNPIKFNLLIYTYSEDKNINKKVYDYLKIKLNENNVNCNLSIIFSNEKKDHDRAIITNYLWIESGDTFNYFKEGGFNTKGTKLEFHPLSNAINFYFAQTTLVNVKNQIEKLENPDKDLMLFGDYKANKLLKF
jgi:hypothetical protein